MDRSAAEKKRDPKKIFARVTEATKETAQATTPSLPPQRMAREEHYCKLLDSFFSCCAVHRSPNRLSNPRVPWFVAGDSFLVPLSQSTGARVQQAAQSQ